MANLTTEEKLTRAKIQIQFKNPFFSYLSLFINLKPDTTNKLPDYAGMGVNARGDLIYKKEFVDELKEDELMGVLCHEIMHLALLHLLRLGSKQMEKWNIATDLIINTMLRHQGFTMPKKCIIADSYDNFKFASGEIKDVSKKNAEEVYDLLPEMKSKTLVLVGKGKGKGQGEKDKQGQQEQDGEMAKGFDLHEFSEAKSEEERVKEEEKWKGLLEEAYCFAKQKGDLPDGMERYIGDLHKNKINWRTLLNKAVTSHFPVDYTWARQSRKSIACGVYLPSVIKEKIDVCVAIDTSGSVDKEQLSDFLSEIIGISKSYQNSVEIRVITHDTEIHDNIVVKNANIDKIKKIKIHGGGGTSHKLIMDFMRDNKDGKKYSLVIFFTDGFSDIESIKPHEYKFKKVFVISKDGQIPNMKGATIIKL